MSPDPFSDVDNDKVSDIMLRGEQLFTAMYGKNADTVQPLLEAIHPDLGSCHSLLQICDNLASPCPGWFSKNIAYGLTYNATHIISQRDTSYAIVAALIAVDTPRQVAWHLANCRRGGASREEVEAVRSIAMQVSSACGIKWRDGVPEVLDE